MANTDLDTDPLLCPCEDCICMAICRLKLFEDLFAECSIVDAHIVDATNYYVTRANAVMANRLKQVQEALNPTRWKYIRGNSR
jgi:hypothetical protein